MNLEQMHPIQRGILTLLLQNNRKLKYSELLPEKLQWQSDKFNYHLQFLVDKQLIQKDIEGYILTTSGKTLISNLDARGNVQQLLKVSIALVVSRDIASSAKEVLMQRRLRKPFYGDVTGIAGKIHFGEKIVEAAQRKLLEETGLSATFTFVGVLRKIKRDASQTVLEDTLYHYCVAENPTGELLLENEFGQHFWATTEKAIGFLQTNVDTGPVFLQIHENLFKGDYTFFYHEQDYTLKEY